MTATGTGESRALGAGQSVFVPDVDGPVAVAEVAPGTSIFRAAPPRRLTAVPRTASSSSDTSDTEATA